MNPCAEISRNCETIFFEESFGVEEIVFETLLDEKLILSSN